MAEIVVISPTSTIRKTASILSKKQFHALPVCEGELWSDVTTTDVNIFLEQYDGVK
jgi:CBS domain-containing protein